MNLEDIDKGIRDALRGASRERGTVAGLRRITNRVIRDWVQDVIDADRQVPFDRTGLLRSVGEYLEDRWDGLARDVARAIGDRTGLDPDAIRASTRRSGVVVSLPSSVWVTLRDEYRRARDEGESVARAARRAARKARKHARDRARVIARTETQAVVNQTALSAGQLGGATHKTWVAMDGARETHRAANGTKLPIDSPFRVGDSTMMHPGASTGSAKEVVNCRCVLRFTDETPDTDETAGVQASANTLEDTMDWEAVLTIEGVDTADGRYLEDGSMSWRQLPLTLMGMTVNDYGHTGSEVVGRIDEITRGENGQIIGRGVFDMDGDAGAEMARLVESSTVTGVSIDAAIMAAEWVETNPDDPEDWDGKLVVTDGVIMGATVCPFPAFEDASIAVVASMGSHATAGTGGQLHLGQRVSLPFTHAKVTTSGEASCGGGDGCTCNGGEPVITAAAMRPAAPTEWFQTPEPDGPQPFEVSDDGRVTGHIATWGTCHTGYSSCVTPPRGDDFSRFHLARYVTADGDDIATGTIVIDTNHADAKTSAQGTIDHYANTGSVVAEVRAVNGEHGIWVSGVARDLDDAGLAELRASKPSGDWRRVDGALKLHGILQVPIPGFPVEREAVLASGSLIVQDPVTATDAAPVDESVDALVGDLVAQSMAADTEPAV